MSKTNPSPNLRPGQLVYSTQGRDRGQAYLVYQNVAKTNFVLLVDGKKRTLKNPKKKNIKHLQGARWVAAELEKRFPAGASVANEAIQEAINTGIKAVKEGSLLG
ncbi:MAG: RNA-binding protein [Bacillota bacterium]